MLFADADAAADMFRRVRWANGLICPRCKRSNVTKYCKYQKNIQRHTCKDCNKMFNNKTGIILHYTRIDIGIWMLSVWMYLCGPLNDISINYIFESIDCMYRYTYYMMRDTMDHIQSIQEKVLSGTCETDEMYVCAASKGVPLETNGEDCILAASRIRQ